jgi:hypothetical protein
MYLQMFARKIFVSTETASMVLGCCYEMKQIPFSFVPENTVLLPCSLCKNTLGLLVVVFLLSMLQP